MTTLVLTIIIPDIEERYGHPVGDSKLPSTEEVVEACSAGSDHMMWLLEKQFTITAEYV